MPKKEVIFKNPARKLNKTLHKPEPYQPEYVRLGMEPAKPAKVASEDFQYAFNKRKPFVTSSAGPKKDVKHEHSQHAIHPQFQQKYPPQVKVSSGFNHEHTWRPTAEFYDEETIPLEGANAQQYPWLDDAPSETLEEEDMGIRTGIIRDDEVELPAIAVPKLMDVKRDAKPVQDKRKVPEPIPEFDEPELSMESIRDNQYCVIVRGRIECICASLEDVENVVETLLFYEGTDPDMDVSVEDIIVFKRLSVRAGVVVKE